MKGIAEMKAIAFAAVALAVSSALPAWAVSFNMLSCCPGEDTAKEARFVWHSDSDACTFWYAKASAPGSAVQGSCASVYKPVSFRSSDVNYYKYTAELSGLEPGTEYIYYVKSGSTQSAVQKFKTAGTSGSYNFLWISDVHSHPDDSAKTNSVNTIIANAKSAAGSIDFILFSGDMVKFGARYDNWQQWNGNASFMDYMHALCPGNKEYYNTGSTTSGANGSSSRIHNKWFLACRNNPKNGADGIESSYWFIRDGVMFVAMDTLADEGVDMDSYVYNNAFALQTNWFDRVVSEQRSKKSFRYLVVFQHYPHFTYAEGDGFQYGSGRYKKWKDLFDKHKVDFALTGDHHNYSRSKKLRGGSENSDGTIYITAPEIGKSLYSPSIKTAANLNSYGVTSGDNSTVKTLMATAHDGDEAVGGVWFSVTPGKMKMHYIGTSASPYDSVEITPKDRGFTYSPSGGTDGDSSTPQTRYRFAVDAPRSDKWCMQLSEIELLDANGDVIPSSAFTIDYDSTTIPVNDSNPYPSSESPVNAVDGVHTGSGKWLDWRAGLSESAVVRSAVWLDFCFAEPTAVSGYQWYTVGDNSTYPGRTPVSWTFSFSDDGGATWSEIDKVVNYDTTTENNALAYSKRFVDLPLPPTTAGGTYYALSVGVNKYSRWPNGENDLGGCVADADDVLSACTNAVKGLWSAGNCYSLHDNGATLSAARSRLQSLADVAESGDTVLYYQSSHGGNSKSDPYRAYLCMTDADYYDDVFASDLLRFKTGVRIVVIIDACHSGGMFKGEAAPEWNFAASVQARMDEIKEEMRTKGVKASNSPSVGWITACDYDQLSVEVNGRGWFTKPFVKEWKSDSTDANGDGFNDFLEIFEVAAPQATDISREPQKLNDDLLASVAAWRLAGSDAFTWSGGYDGNRISSGKNWEGGVAPSANSGAALTFPFSQDTTVANDYDSLFARTISFPASNGRGVFTGGPVMVAESIVNSASATNRFESAVTFSGNIDVTGEMDFADGVTGTVPAHHTTYRGNYNLTTTGSWTPPSGSRVPSGSTLSMPNGTFYCHINSLTIERDAAVTVGAAKMDRTSVAYLLGENDGIFKTTGVLTSSGTSSVYHYLLHTGVENTSKGLIALDGLKINGSAIVYANSYGGKYQMAIGNNGIKKKQGASGYFLIRNDSKPQYIGSWCNGNDYKIAIVDSSGNYPVDTSEYVLYGSRTDRIYNINFDTTDCFNPGVRNTVRDMSPICGAVPANVSVGIYGTGEFRFENTAVNAAGLYSGGTVVSNSATVAILAGSCPGRGNLTLRDTATLSLPGAASGTATVFGTLSLAPGTTVSFGSIAAGTTPLSVGGLTVGAGTPKPVISVDVSSLAAGTYPLIVSSSATSATADSFTLSTSGATDKPLSLVKSGNSICLEVLSGVHGKWLGGNGGNRFSVAANWDDGEVPGAGDALDFSSVTSATAIEADVNATFGAVTMGSGVVTFTGSLTATSFSDTSKIAVGANSTVTLDGDLVFANPTNGNTDYIINKVDASGTFVVTGVIESSTAGMGYVVPAVNAGDGTIVAKGLVQNSRCSDNPSFRLVRDAAGMTRWVIGAAGIVGTKDYWMLNNAGRPEAEIKPDTSDFTVSAKIGNRQVTTLTFDTTGRDGEPHVITLTGGIYREGNVVVAGTGMVMCDYALGSAYTVASSFTVKDSATLALSTIADIGTGAVTMQKGTTLSLGAAGYSFRGSFAVSGGSGKVSVKIGDGPVAAGKYTVFSATSISASDSDFALANAVPQDWTVAFSISGKSLVLEVTEPIPAVAADAAPEAVANAIDGVGFADAGVKDAINGSAAEYNSFRAWAASVKGAAGSATAATAAGESAVIANANAAAAYLLGAERLFANAPKVEIGDVSVGESDAPGGGQGADSPVMTVAVTVKDGEVPVSCAAEKVAALFEATGDLGDWTGAAKLTPTVNVEVGEGAVMRFTVTPGDGTQPRAFLRIHK